MVSSSNYVVPYSPVIPEAPSSLITAPYISAQLKPDVLEAQQIYANAQDSFAFTWGLQVDKLVANGRWDKIEPILRASLHEYIGPNDDLVALLHHSKFYEKILTRPSVFREARTIIGLTIEEINEFEIALNNPNPEFAKRIGLSLKFSSSSISRILKHYTFNPPKGSGYNRSYLFWNPGESGGPSNEGLFLTFPGNKNVRNDEDSRAFVDSRFASGASALMGFDSRTPFHDHGPEGSQSGGHYGPVYLEGYPEGERRGAVMEAIHKAPNASGDYIYDGGGWVPIGKRTYFSDKEVVEHAIGNVHQGLLLYFNAYAPQQRNVTRIPDERVKKRSELSGLIPDISEPPALETKEVSTTPPISKPQSKQVVIVGGGATGTLLAIQFLKHASGPLDIKVIDPTEELGKGSAHGPDDRNHVLNVRVDQMSAFKEDPHDFLKWLQKKRYGVSEGSFVPRDFYSAYLRDRLNAALEAKSDSVKFEHIRDYAVSQERDLEGNRLINLKTKPSLKADHLVLALGNVPPAVPKFVSTEASSHPNFISNPFVAGAYHLANPKKSAVILGSGLTAVDAIRSLNSAGVTDITVLSRNGRWPEHHSNIPPYNSSEGFPQSLIGKSPHEVRDLLIEEIQLAKSQGSNWRAPVVKLRPAPIINSIWAAWTPEQQEEFVSDPKLYRTWHKLRHRIAPEAAEELKLLAKAGKLKIRAGDIQSLERDGDSLSVRYRDHETTSDQIIRGAGLVVNATGPDYDWNNRTDPLVVSLRNSGDLRANPNRLGLDVDSKGNLLREEGQIVEDVSTYGPPRQGSRFHLETTAIPDIKDQAHEGAQDILRRLNIETRTQLESREKPVTLRSSAILGLEELGAYSWNRGIRYYEQHTLPDREINPAHNFLQSFGQFYLADSFKDLVVNGHFDGFNNLSLSSISEFGLNHIFNGFSGGVASLAIQGLKAYFPITESVAELFLKPILGVGLSTTASDLRQVGSIDGLGLIQSTALYAATNILTSQARAWILAGALATGPLGFLAGAGLLEGELILSHYLNEGFNSIVQRGKETWQNYGQNSYLEI